MSTALIVYLQSTGKTLGRADLSVVAAAQKLKTIWKVDKLVGLALGPSAEQLAKEATACGFDEVVWCAKEHLTQYTASHYAAAVQQLFDQLSISVFVTGATSNGKDLTPRVAALLDSGQASDIIGVNEDGSLKRPMYAGDVIADIVVETPLKLVTIRTSAFAPAIPGEKDESKVREVTVLPYSGKAQIEFVSSELSGGDRPELSAASVVVSGGRALQSSENFEKYLYPLADKLGAAIGASRAAVDSGYAPNDWQVGQTGKIVAPDLYIAVGISGAIQHLAGMKDSKVIVAINKDEEAPIFEVADYGLVADLYEVVPQLTEAIAKAKAS
jgi:electron transfer flavoprotein alpha subunit